MTASVQLPQIDPPDPFAARLLADDRRLSRASLRTLQLNLGKMCNIACHHCHVEAGPNRTEVMAWETMEKILAWIDEVNGRAWRGEDACVADRSGRQVIEIADLTGGSPEMNPHFLDLVRELRARGLHVLDRCNPTILEEPGYEDLHEFLAAHGVEIVASLPCYLEDNVDRQRGRGVFDKSIRALKKLNAIGYGKAERAGKPESRRAGNSEGGCADAGSESPAFRLSGSLVLDLVYNPVGYGLPPAQDGLERDYKKHLRERYGIEFNRLWTITNMPIRRFEHALRRDGRYDAYMDKLAAAHNGDNVDAVMCRHLVSVGWRGTVYDCDFNQMLSMPIAPARYGPGDDEHEVERRGRKLWEYAAEDLLGRGIRTGGHCFGCTAGAGSSCTGALSWKGA